MSNMTIHRIRLSKMQKIVNVIAVSSGIISLAVVGSGYMYMSIEMPLLTTSSLELLRQSWDHLVHWVEHLSHL